MNTDDFFQSTRLDNGVRVVTEVLPHVKTASLGVWVNAGTRHELADQNGVAHLLEHMAFKGTRRRSALRIAEEIEDVGGHLNAYTSREHTAYYARILGDDIALASDIVSDILINSVFDEDELARERNVVLQEIGQVQDTPDDLIFDLFQEVAYPEQALGRSVLGPPQIVARMPRETLISFMSEAYMPERLVVAAAGAVDHEKFVGLVDSLFGELSGNTKKVVEPGQYRGGRIAIERPLDQVHVILGLEAPSIFDDDYYPLQLFSMMLGGGMSSRLFQEVREKRGMAYSIFSFASCFEDTGTLGVYAGTSEAELENLVPVICDELTGFAGTASEMELVRARNQLKASLMMSLESCSAVCEDIARQQLIFGRRITTDETISKINRVSLDDIRRVASKLFDHTEPTVAAIGPIKSLPDQDAIRNRLRAH